MLKISLLKFSSNKYIYHLIFIQYDKMNKKKKGYW